MTDFMIESTLVSAFAAIKYNVQYFCGFYSVLTPVSFVI